MMGFFSNLFTKQPVAVPVAVPHEPVVDLLTLSQLRQIMPKCLVAPLWIYPLNVAMAEREINSTERIAAFLAQIAHESQELNRLQESLSYTADGLKRTFRKYFTDAEAVEFAGNQEGIANRVYSARMGNLGEASGDGWRYRGRSPIMLTGRGNYRACGIALGIDLENDPNLAIVPITGARVAAWFWSVNGLNIMADIGSFESITRVINGGTAGAKERQKYFEHAKAVMR